MASPTELMEAIATVTRIPMATIVDHDRRLIKGGLRTKSGRGFNVAQVTARDAAHLVTSMLASPHAKDAPETVARYAHTSCDRTRSSEDGFGAAKLTDLARLPTRHSFIDALEVLISSIASGSLARLIREAEQDWLPRIEVFALTRATRGRIRLAGLPDAITVSMEYAPYPRSDATHRRGRADLGDFEESRRITDKTILAIASLLGKDNGHARR